MYEEPHPHLLFFIEFENSDALSIRFVRGLVSLIYACVCVYPKNKKISHSIIRFIKIIYVSCRKKKL